MVSRCFAFKSRYSSTRAASPAFLSSWWVALSRLLCTSLSSSSRLVVSLRESSFSLLSLDMTFWRVRDFSAIDPISSWMSSRVRELPDSCCFAERSWISVWRVLISPSYFAIVATVRDKNSTSLLASDRSLTFLSKDSTCASRPSLWISNWASSFPRAGISVPVRRTHVS